MKDKRGKRKNRLTRYVCASLFFLFPFSFFNNAQAQVAGLNTLTVLDLSSTARTAGLGFDYLSFYGDDLTVGIDNPSLLRSTMGGTGVMSLVPMFSGSSMGSLTYAHTFNRLGTISFGFHYMAYGRFEEYDEEENHLGDFSAGDYGLTIGWGLWLDSNFSVGANFKPVLSQYESYTAFAVAFDVAASYVSDSRAFAATVMARNIGAQIVTFDETIESLPFELSAELSYKLQRAPFRIYFAATELQRWNLRYDDPLQPTSTVDPFTGEVTEEGWLTGVFDNLMRHTQFGVELNLGTSLFARLGYSWRQTAEMRGVDAFNLSGFSFGLGFRSRHFEFSYARRNYHLGQAPNYLTLSYRF
ncbi:MAG: type IX secretion system protein PorQ [Bacteroidales bacterium]|nr:type IX secretion system protein PorQ [Bacteroidales bacterium]